MYSGGNTKGFFGVLHVLSTIDKIRNCGDKVESGMQHQNIRTVDGEADTTLKKWKLQRERSAETPIAVRRDEKKTKKNILTKVDQQHKKKRNHGYKIAAT